MALDQAEARPKSHLTPVRDFCLEMLFPAHCSICRVQLGWRTLRPVCASCWGDVRLIAKPICSRCGSPFAGNVNQAVSGTKTCDLCRENPPAFSQARSIFSYEGTIRHLIHSFKYQGKVRIGEFLGRSMVAHWEQDPDLPGVECIVPVPIGVKKLRHREFNQSFILARAIGKFLKVPVYPFALRRIREVAPQMKLSRQERWQNIHDAFGMREGHRTPGKKILLVDDVFTTGATATECSRILMQCGAAEEVRVLTLARSVLGADGRLVNS
ncbi:MAG: ComF family protein [bacterium]